MANLKEIRTRINSVNSTKQITSAMKMVSAAKLRKAQDAVIQLRPYANKLQEILAHLSDEICTSKANKYVEKRDEKQKVALIIVTSNKGLCGAFNSSIIKSAVQYIQDNYSLLNARQAVDIITIGKKGTEFFKNKGFNVVLSVDEIFDNLNFNQSVNVSSKLIEQFLTAEYDSIELIYNQFKNAAVQLLTIESFLPLKLDEFIHEEDNNQHFDFIFEPNRIQILEDLIPKCLNINFYKALLDSHASEHGARMTAMHKATDNATDLLKDLRLQYNKARQASITNEILEIVSGAEALKG